VTDTAAATLLDVAPGDDRPVHFVGVAGAGMSALAELLARRGVRITGCDSSGCVTEDLLHAGVRFVGVHDPAHVADARAVVVTAAMPRDHPELKRARAAGIPVIRRADALAEAVREATVIAIAGTHGKTSTTALTTEALAAAGLDPTGMAGGRVTSWGGNLRRGGDALFVVEADEYDRSFLSLTPAVAVVTNVEADHLDIYGDIEQIRSAFEQFVRPARFVVVCADDSGAATLALPRSAEIIRYGIDSDDARLRARNITRHDTATTGFTVEYDGKRLGGVELPAAGRHSVLNALAAIGSGIAVGASFDGMRPGLEEFTGVERRFQRLGTFGGVTIVDDYAHHPTEIAATLEAARLSFPGARVTAAFQPHLFSRTRDFAAEFGVALARADAVFLTEIYAAREQPISGVSSDLIAAALGKQGRPPHWRGGRADLAAALAGHARPGDLVITIGAGDVTRAAHELREILSGAGRVA